MQEHSLSTPMSTAQSPDLDWSQIRETVLMLELAATQIDTAMKDSNASVNTLTQAFTGMAESLARISARLAALPEGGEAGISKAEMVAETSQVSGMVHQAIISFQFYDKLVQRLDHVCASLSQMGDLIGDRKRLFNPEEWAGLQNAIRAKYTTDEERFMFEAVLKGIPVDQAIEQFMAEKQSQGNDIELF